MSIINPSVFRGLAFIVCALLFSRCESDEEKRPGKIETYIGLHSNAAMKGKLTIDHAYINLQSIDLTGTNPAEAVVTYPNAVPGEINPIVLTNQNATSFLTLKVKMDKYNPLKLTLTLRPDDHSLVHYDDNDSTMDDFSFSDFLTNARPAIVLTGRFDNRGVSTNVFLAIDEVMPLAVEAEQFETSIVQIGKENRADIYFNPALWFEDISTTMMEEAMQIEHNGSRVIFIHPEFNHKLHRLIKTKIEDPHALAAKIIVTKEE